MPDPTGFILARIHRRDAALALTQGLMGRGRRTGLARFQPMELRVLRDDHASGKVVARSGCGRRNRRGGWQEVTLWDWAGARLRDTSHWVARWVSLAPWHDCAPCHSQPDGAPSAADPPSGPLNVPANSRQVSPRGAPLACSLPNSARHGHRGPPSSGLCGHLTPSSSPSIGIWPSPFAFPYPSALVSTPAPIPSVDSGQVSPR